MVGDAEVHRALLKTNRVLRGPWAQLWPYSNLGSYVLIATYLSSTIFLFGKL